MTDNNHPTNPARPTPNWNGKTPPDANPHPNRTPHGGEVKIADRFAADQIFRHRHPERRPTGQS
jgi:hypothetical protein